MTRVALLLIAAALLSTAARAATVDVVRVNGIINEGTVKYVKRGLSIARADESPVLLVVLDTPGGLLSSTREIVQAINESPIPVAVYVAPGGASATSAGTILTMAAHYAGMAPGTNIGAAHPVGGQGEDIKGAMKTKAENDTVAFIRAQALLRGRNADWAEEAIRKSVAVPADEALKLKVVDFIADDLKDAVMKIDAQPARSGVAGAPRSARQVHATGLPLREIPMTAAERFLAFIGDPNVSYLLMTLGSFGLYIELTTPGAIFPGVLGAISLILAFVSFATLPVNLGGLALLVLAFLLFGAEPFITSHGVLTVGGIVSLLLGGLFVLDASTGDLLISLALLLPTALALAGATFTLMETTSPSRGAKA
ncbi:MAG: nodulation protein NfeD [Deltaproteobacteria bacterium]|nr:nodulation protein NfeD [Deltaproteobacteria bacterium]